jgi:hypothetical protein
MTEVIPAINLRYGTELPFLALIELPPPAPFACIDAVPQPT